MDYFLYETLEGHRYFCRYPFTEAQKNRLEVLRSDMLRDKIKLDGDDWEILIEEHEDEAIVGTCHHDDEYIQIHPRALADRDYARYVYFHELAHKLLGPGWGHGVEFFTLLCVMLCRSRGVRAWQVAGTQNLYNLQDIPVDHDGATVADLFELYYLVGAVADSFDYHALFDFIDCFAESICTLEEIADMLKNWDHPLPVITYIDSQA